MSPGVERNGGCGDRFRLHEQYGAGHESLSDGGSLRSAPLRNKTDGVSRFCGR